MIHRRGSGFGVAVYDPETKRMRWVGTFRTEAEAIRAEAAATGETRQGYATSWLSERPRPAPKTRELYADAVRRFISVFGDEPTLDGIDPEQVRSWALGEPLHVRSAIQAMFTDARRDQVYSAPNPLAGTSPYRPGRKRPGTLTIDELYRLAECAVEAWGEYGLDTLAPAILATGYAHLTRGELFALRLDDVQGDELRITRGPGFDLCPLPPALAAALRRRTDRGGGWMFPTITGKQLTEGTHYRYWSVIRMAYGRPDMGFHEVRLRHEQ